MEINDDDMPNFVIVNKLSALPRNFKMYKRDFSSLDEEALLSDRSAINWLEVFPSSASASVNDLFSVIF